MTPAKPRQKKLATARKKANRDLVYRALTDPKFRRLLQTNPRKALGKPKLTAVQLREVDLVLASVKGIQSQMNNMADKLLCACSVVV